MIVIAEHRIDAEWCRQRTQLPRDPFDRHHAAAEVTAGLIVACEQDEIGPRGIGQLDDATDLGFVDEARTGVQVGNDGNAKPPETGPVGALERQRMVDNGEARGLEPKGVDAKRDGDASK
jgi:hypothetical protein